MINNKAKYLLSLVSIFSCNTHKICQTKTEKFNKCESEEVSFFKLPQSYYSEDFINEYNQEREILNFYYLSNKLASSLQSKPQILHYFTNENTNNYIKFLDSLASEDYEELDLRDQFNLNKQSKLFFNDSINRQPIREQIEHIIDKTNNLVKIRIYTGYKNEVNIVSSSFLYECISRKGDLYFKNFRSLKILDKPYFEEVLNEEPKRVLFFINSHYLIYAYPIVINHKYIGDIELTFFN